MRLPLVLLVLLASGLIAAGCGGDDDDDGTTVSVPTEATVPGGLPTEATVPTVTDAEGLEEAQKEAEEGLENVRENCLKGVDELPQSQQAEARKYCESLPE